MIYLTFSFKQITIFYTFFSFKSDNNVIDVNL
jgi:hypothetical protein